MDSFGEGGGYDHPSSDASDAMETQTRQQGAAAVISQSADSLDQHPKPVAAANDHPSEPFPLHPSLTRPHPAVARPPQTDAVGPRPSIPTEADRRRYSLWDGLAAPMELSAQKINGISEDQAATLGRSDYDSHILGQRDSAAAPAQLRAPGVVSAGSWGSRPPLSDAPGAVAAVGPEVFVALNLDLKKHPDETLKDAVADLGRIAGFRQDARFTPAVAGAGPDQVALWGWIPSSRVGAAMKVPTVARLEINPAVRRAAPETATDMLLGVRVPPGRSLAEAIALLEGDPAAPGLRVQRAIGTQTAPGTAETVLVLQASVPINLLPRLMALRDVVKMMPAPPALAPSSSQRSKRLLARDARRFLAFVMDHSPMLLVLTLLMLLPWVGSRVAAVARIFVPYR
jgi:hypothetical protein